jgi:hypothetical protein
MHSQLYQPLVVYRVAAVAYVIRVCISFSSSPGRSGKGRCGSVRISVGIELELGLIYSHMAQKLVL